MMSLTSYWVEITAHTELEKNPFPMGIGVTAYNDNDAKGIIQRDAIGSRQSLTISSVREISFDDIENDHVKKNMGVFIERGIWFPKGLNRTAIIRS
ncbi:hypothetical protein [Boseongicola sp. H5]|uniref:hypothetical protein n=1 Tax=Boseongicola sp. H5 TaxID=2763261 RepID=UPI001D0BCC04|nr:hypothetical protein [Boseongicola sp. H5]